MRSHSWLALAALASACTEGTSLRTEDSASSVSKVTICHIPPSAPLSTKTMEIASPAVAAHLAHGDYVGACQTCTPGTTQACYSGPAGTSGAGLCHPGTETCAADTGYGPCSGEVVPAPEICGDGLDQDCDTFVDESCVCVPGTSSSCYEGPPGTEGVGACVAGTQTCDAGGSGFSACTDVEPAAETCGDGIDQNCDGTADDGCVCTPSATRACYSGSNETADVGTCRSGTQQCNDTGTGYEGACTGEVLPAPETCGDALDNDCNGTIDNGCVCTPGATAACYGGPAGTEGIGACQAGMQTCNTTGTGYGTCAGDVVPSAELCLDGIDNDCDGTVDGGCITGRAWNDVDRNGLQDPGEEGIAGVTFLLRTSTGSLVATSVTDTSGRYSFSTVPAGTYYMEVVESSLLFFTKMNVGTNDEIDSDFNPDTDRSDPFTMTTAPIDHIDVGWIYVDGV